MEEETKGNEPEGKDVLDKVYPLYFNIEDRFNFAIIGVIRLLMAITLTYNHI